MKTIEKSKAKTKAKAENQKPKAKPPAKKKTNKLPSLGSCVSGFLGYIILDFWQVGIRTTLALRIHIQTHGREGTESNPLQNDKACGASKWQSTFAICLMAYPVSWPHEWHTHGGDANKRLLILHNPPFDEAFRNTTTRRQTYRDAIHTCLSNVLWQILNYWKNISLQFPSQKKTVELNAERPLWSIDVDVCGESCIQHEEQHNITIALLIQGPKQIMCAGLAAHWIKHSKTIAYHGVLISPTTSNFQYLLRFGTWKTLKMNIVSHTESYSQESPPLRCLAARPARSDQGQACLDQPVGKRKKQELFLSCCGVSWWLWSTMQQSYSGGLDKPCYFAISTYSRSGPSHL